jgi:prolyl 4-hydroxylase
MSPYCVHYARYLKRLFQFQSDFFHNLSGIKGQRYGTILVYLNDDFEGGTTSFPKCGIEAAPITSDGIFWYACCLNGGKSYCFEDSLHQGNPPKSGVKYPLNVWVRFAPFCLA